MRRAYFQTLERARAFSKSIRDSGKWYYLSDQTGFKSGFVVYY